MMPEQDKIPGYLFGALGAGDERSESALKVIKTSVNANGGFILNPHVADRAENQVMLVEMTPNGLKEYDWKKLNEAEFGIGIVSLPSIGVGREIERMLTTRRIPVLALRRLGPGYRSALIEGEDDPNFVLKVYKNYSNLDNIVENFMQYLRERTHG